MHCSQIEFRTPAYDESVWLRDKLLRKPINMEFYAEDLAKEWNMIHFGCYDEQERLIGILILAPQKEGAVKMRQVAVDDHLHGKGVGTFMVKESERLAVKLGFTKMVLNAREVAVPFYKKLKYKKLGKKFEEVGIPHFYMEKDL